MVSWQVHNITRFTPLEESSVIIAMDGFLKALHDTRVQGLRDRQVVQTELKETLRRHIAVMGRGEYYKQKYGGGRGGGRGRGRGSEGYTYPDQYSEAEAPLPETTGSANVSASVQDDGKLPLCFPRSTMFLFHTGN